MKEFNEAVKRLDEGHTASVLELQDAVAKLCAALELLPDRDIAKQVMQASSKAGNEIVKYFQGL